MATLRQVIGAMKKVALKQPIVNECYEGSVYDINAKPTTKYANVIITQQQHSETDTLWIFNFYVFYVDRLVDDLETNRLQVQSIGTQVLSNIFTTLEEEYDWVITNRNYTSFEQRFSDLCAGSYASIRVEVVKDSLCAETYDE